MENNDVLLAPRPSSVRGNVALRWIRRNAALVALSAVLAAGLGAQASAGLAEAALAPEGSAAVEEAALGPAAAFEKSEVVYADLDAAGAPVAAYVVNRFDVEQAGSVVDYGDYSTARNLSTTDALSLDDGVVSFEAEEGTFFYQGNLDAVQLPWTLDVAYSLDGVETDAADLAGKSGRVGITLSTSKNPDVDPAFFDSFMLQATFALDSSKCSRISAEGATVAQAGADQTVTFAALPGHDGSFGLAMDVVDFAMDGVQLAGVPYASPVEVPDTSGMTEGMQQLADGVNQVAGGSSALSGSGGDLASGAEALSGGVAQAAAGADDAASAGAAIAQDTSAMGDAIGQQAAGISQLRGVLDGIDVATLPPDAAKQVEALKAGMAAVDSGMAQLDGEYAAYDAGVQAYVDGVGELAGGLDGLRFGADELADGVRRYVAGVEKLDGGIQSLDGETSKLPATVQTEIDDMLSEFEFPEFASVSFASAQNLAVRSVQFVMTTPAIAPAAPEPQEGPDEPEETVADRFLDLFR